MASRRAALLRLPALAACAGDPIDPHPPAPVRASASAEAPVAAPPGVAQAFAALDAESACRLPAALAPAPAKPGKDWSAPEGAGRPRGTGPLLLGAAE